MNVYAFFILSHDPNWYNLNNFLTCQTLLVFRNWSRQAMLAILFPSSEPHLHQCEMSVSSNVIEIQWVLILSQDNGKGYEYLTSYLARSSNFHSGRTSIFLVMWFFGTTWACRISSRSAKHIGHKKYNIFWQNPNKFWFN